MKFTEVINYEIYNLKKDICIDNPKDKEIMHIDTTMKDEKGNKFDLSVNDLDNHDLTMEIFNLIGKNIRNERTEPQNQLIHNKNDKLNLENDSTKFNEINDNKTERKYRRIDSPETVIELIKNSKNNEHYQELSSEKSIDSIEEDTNPLTITDFIANNKNSNENKLKKIEIDLTDSDDYDPEGDNFGNAE